jgi:hypothetical protein
MFINPIIVVESYVIKNMMKCVLCHPCQTSPSNNHTQSRKGIVYYNPLHDITSMKRHIDNEHAFVLLHYKQKGKVFEEYDVVHKKREEEKRTHPKSIG